MNPALAAIDKHLEDDKRFQDSMFVEMNLNGHRNCKDGWYARIKSEKGLEVAEDHLERYAKDSYFREFSSSLAPILSGIRALAEYDTKNDIVHLIEDCSKIKYPIEYNLRGENTKIIWAQNPERGFHCNCNGDIGLPGEKIWERGDWPGRLRLQSIVFCYTPGMLRTVDLIFPYRRNAKLQIKNNYQVSVDGYSVVRIERSGEIYSLEMCLTVNDGIAIWASLGIVKEDRVVRWQTVSGGFMDENLDLPDAIGYLARNISTLGPYLTSVAGELTKHRENKGGGGE